MTLGWEVVQYRVQACRKCGCTISEVLTVDFTIPVEPNDEPDMQPDNQDEDGENDQGEDDQGEDEQGGEEQGGNDIEGDDE